METKKQPEDLFVKLLKININTNQRKFAQYDAEIAATREKLDEIEELFLKHSKYSLSNSQTLLFLVFGLFVSLLLLALLGTSIEGEIGNSKINYSANGVLQVLLTVLTASGGGIALNQIQKSMRKK
jgi:hypothetical protein